MKTILLDDLREMTNGRSRKPKSPLETIVPLVNQLETDDLEELRDIIDALLVTRQVEEEEEPKPKSREDKAKQRGARGGARVESKMIRGYGPYLYLRYWSRKVYKSIYLGKPQASD